MIWGMIKKGGFSVILCIALGGCIQPLKIPHNNTSHGTYHTVVPKETVYAISKRFHTSAREIIEQNGLYPPYALSVGQVLFVPDAATYTVVKQDTLYSISRAYDVDMNMLAKENNIKAPYTLSMGQQLRIPSGKTKALSSPQQPAPTPKKTALIKKDSPQKKATPLPTTPKRTGRFDWPVKGKVISSFGNIGGGKHNDGINISAKRGTPIRAAENGVVAYAGNKLKGFGNLLLIKHSNGFVTAYAHADSLSVKRGQVVKKGQTIGKVGSTGNVKYPQLHFEIRKGTKAINPQTQLK